MTVFEEAPRTFEDIAHDVADVLDKLGGLTWPSVSDEPAVFQALAWETARLARQVGELAQRLAGDTEGGT